VLGLGTLGIAQLVLVGAAALITGAVAAGSKLPSAAPAVFALLVLWFILGFALYSAAFGLAGSLVSRQEDVQAVTSPLAAIIVAAYIVAASALSNPDGGLATVASYIPPLAPMTVPARVVLGSMGAVALVVSVLITLVAIAAVVALAAVVYERAVLQTGGRVGLREVLQRT
jgi:ABC-2 type transport system permease protein